MLTRLPVLLHMRKSARAGATASSAAPSVESANSRLAILSMSMRWNGLFARIFDANATLSTRLALNDARLQQLQTDLADDTVARSGLAVEPPVGPRGADHHDLSQRLASQKTDHPAVVGVGDVERRGARALQALEHALDRNRRTNAIDARAHECARRLVAAMLAHRAQDVLAGQKPDRFAERI